MATKNPRINITFDKPTALLLASLAEQENKSLSHLAKDLLLDALERREDVALSAIAKLRDKPAEPTIEHKDAWE